MTFAYKKSVSGSARECHCEAEGRGNLRRLDCFASPFAIAAEDRSLAMTKTGMLTMTDSRGLRYSSIGCAARLVNRFSYFDEPRNRNRWTSRKGMTLTEMAVVIGIVAVMVGLTLPAANVLYNSFESTSGAKSMINAALSSAKSIAIKEQRYAGIRFQKRYTPNNPDPLNASQYMIFIISDPNIGPGVQGNLSCRAVDGITPIKLPDSIGVMDSNATDNFAIDTDSELFNNTTFTVLFSPSGKLIIHKLWVRNRNGVGINDNSSKDDVFNTLTNVSNNIGMFIQDESTDYIEQSRNSFIIYETKKLKQVSYNNRWTGYLNQLKAVYVNPYMGTIVEDK